MMSDFSQPLPAELREDIDRKSWLDLACVLLVLGGALNAIWGLSAIVNSGYVERTVIFSNVHAWGWAFLVWGVLQIFAGLAVYRGARWGAVVAIGTAFVNALGQWANARANPFWSVAILALDIFVIYGLVAKAGVFRRSA
jgi:hypothetical protein